ncbi:MAG: hypothetical protein Q8P26_05715 [Candidatus Levybacteria bacterium]|nr:hypothetical protein [Candidatus Levybacteria bacterium]MDZ4228529.1 hypothetical protein [Candidatus Levybacteria bacterium]
MDPQKLSQLDPKLRDAYQRVMGTTVPKPSTRPVAQTQTTPPVNGPTPPIQKPTIPVNPPISSNSNPNINPSPAIKLDEPAVRPIQPPTQPQTTIEPPAQPELSPKPQAPLGSANFDQLNSQVSSAASSNFSAPTPMTQNQAVIIKKKNRLLPILAVIVVLVFFVVYTLFWVKIFNLKLPFLP